MNLESRQRSLATPCAGLQPVECLDAAGYPSVELEQIDALDTMAINPLQYLVAPKLVAGVLGVPLLVAIFDVVGIYGGSLVGVDLLGVSEGAYWNSIASAVEWKDVYGGILKSISFGLIVSWVCCYKGFYTRQSAEGLGSATTEAVVLSSVLILVGDYILTSVLL